MQRNPPFSWNNEPFKTDNSFNLIQKFAKKNKAGFITKITPQLSACFNLYEKNQLILFYLRIIKNYKNINNNQTTKV